MKLDILTQTKEKKGTIEMPAQFSTPVRADLIKRAVEVEQSKERQQYGANARAGLRHSAYVSKRRNNYRSTYGIGQSRTPRKVMSRSGTRFNWTGAVVPQTVGGRRAHPPKATKVWIKKINRKEYNLAMRSAMAATLSKELASARGHVVPDTYPLVVDNALEAVSKTKDVKKTLETMGLSGDLTRASVKKVRAGKGTMRGRKYKRRKGALIVVSKDCALLKAARSIPGIDVVSVDSLTAQMLAPGAVPGRLTLWSANAIEQIKKENLFV